MEQFSTDCWVHILEQHHGKLDPKAENIFLLDLQLEQRATSILILNPEQSNTLGT
jgi:hypothetical protein